VLVNCYDERGSLPAVVPDEVTGGFTATQALLDAGHRRIAFINATEPAPATVGRLRGYREAMAGAHQKPAPEWIVNVRPEQEGGYDAARHLLSLRELPTAVFCYNDRVAMGLYVVLAKAGVRVPDDMSVVGYDNQEVISAHLDPPLTTVQLPHYELGYKGVQKLLSAHRDARRRKHIPTVLPCPLVPRSSVSEPDRTAARRGSQSI
jgi:LacI family transcriptional regulator